MSLKDAYSMAHSAQCRLHMEANRPERNLRFVVGHLMHYESVRLRIVEIEHDISKSERAKAVAFKGTGHVDQQIQRKPSTGQLGGRKSPPPPMGLEPLSDDSDDDEDSDPWSGGEDDDDDEGGGLGLTRFPSASARAPGPPGPPGGAPVVPDLEPDNEDDYDEDDDEPVSPEEPDQAILEELMKGDGNADLAKMYNGMRKCPCHKHQDAPGFEKMWELPAGVGGGKEGVTRAVAQVWV